MWCDIYSRKADSQESSRHSSVTADRGQDEHPGHHTEDSHHRQGAGCPDHQKAVSKVDTEEETNILHVSLVPFWMQRKAPDIFTEWPRLSIIYINYALLLLIANINY